MKGSFAMPTMQPRQLSRFIFGEEPKRVIGCLEHDPDFGTDRLASGLLDFGRGTATFTCSTQLSAYQRVNIFGTTGRIEIEISSNSTLPDGSRTKPGNFANDGHVGGAYVLV